MAGEKILLVEYDPRILKETKDILMKAGFVVVEAADGLAALAAYEEARPDLILMSPMLPKLHGFDVCQRIKASPSGKNVPVVIITDVYKGRKYRTDAIHLYKADDYLEKPIADEELIKILNNLLIKYNKVKKEADKEKVQQIQEAKTIEIDASKLPLIEERKVSDKKVVEKEGEVKEKQLEKESLKELTAKKEMGKDVKQQVGKISLDSDIEKKLADTLSGLEIGLPKFTQKKVDIEIKRPGIEKPKEKDIGEKKQEVKKEPEKLIKQEEDVISKGEDKLLPKVEIEPEDILTARDIFEEVIQGVEEEVKEEVVKEIDKEKVEAKKEVERISKEEKKVKDISKELSKKIEVIPAVEKEKKAVEKSKGIDDLEKKLSDTLAGISKELGLRADAEKISKGKEQIANKVFQEEEEEKHRKFIKEKEKEKKVIEEKPSLKEIPLSDILDKIETQDKEEKKVEVVEEEKKVMEAKEEVVGAEIGTIQFGDYILLEKIATGGMAELFKAKKKGVEGFEKIVAIKRILPHLCDNEEFIKMFIDEAKLAAQLSHPNIVQIYELGKVNSNFFIAMELVEGKDMRAVLKKTKEMNRFIPLPIVLYIASKLSGALDYAHRMKDSKGESMNIVHRDVSPQNIIISYEGEVKLVDFGIAKAAVKAHQTQTGALKGKLLYMSPEQASAKEVDKRSDIFALGIIMWEMLTNKSLFYEKGDSEVSIIEKVRNAVIPDVKSLRGNVPDELKSILIKALQKDPAKRYQNASELQIALDSLLHKMHIQVSQSMISGFISALFSEDEFRLDEIERQLEPYIPETKIIEPEIKEEVISKVVSEPIKEMPIKQKVSSEVIEKPYVHKPSVKMESFKTSLEEEKKKNYLTYIIPVLIGVIALAVILFNIFKGKETASIEGKNKLELSQQLDTQEKTLSKGEVKQEATLPEVVESGKEVYGGKTGAKISTEEKTIPKEKELPVQEKPKIEEKITEPKKEERKEEKPVLASEEINKKEEPTKIEQPIPVESKSVDTKEVSVPKQIEPVEEETKEKAVKETAKIEKKEDIKKPEEESAKAPQIKEGDLVEMGPDVVMPVAIKKSLPRYPALAMKTKVEGLVILQALVSEKGDVLAVKVLRGNELLVDAAKEAVLQWKFTPATKNGVKVKIWYTITIPFKLK